MKISRSFSILSVSLLFLLFAAACNQEDTPQPDSNNQFGRMEAVVNGEMWEAELGASSTFIQGFFNITGQASDGSAITISLSGFEEAEFTSFNGSSNALAYVPDNSGVTPGFASHGPGGLGRAIITEINEVDSLVSGTFEFRAVGGPVLNDTLIVMEGIFEDVPFAVETVAAGDNALKVDIDGSNWEAQLVNAVIYQNKINITGTGPQAAQTVGLYLPEDITPGTYELDSPLSSDYGAQYNRDAETFLMAESGELVISHHDQTNKIIEGTFSFEANQFLGTAAASLANGSFYVAY